MQHKTAAFPEVKSERNDEIWNHRHCPEGFFLQFLWKTKSLIMLPFTSFAKKLKGANRISAVTCCC